MKKILAICALALSVVDVNSAQGIDLGVNASYWDTKDGDATWGFGGKVAMPFLIDRLHIEGRVYEFEEDNVEFFGEVDIIPIDLGLAFYFTTDQTVNPYVLGGISYNFVDTSNIGLDNDFGYYVGAGLEVPLGEGFALTGEVLFRAAEFDSEAGLDESFDTTGTTMNFGLRFRL